jgi:Phage-related minor tail protein
MNNDTTVNVDIRATDTASATVNNAATNFSNLWEQIALGQGALQLAQKGFQLLEQAIVGSIKEAGNFQQQLTMLVTGAGESQSNIGIISKGIKQVAIDTGTTLDQLTQGAYQIESAGFHGANAINILKMAAEGAKADGADLGTMTNALTTVMHDYNIPASKAAQVTDQMIAAVARGKMHMQDFASSLSTVLPLANQVGLSFAEVAGAEATMTAGGVSADQATQDLASLIRSLQEPTQQQTTMMQNMGLSSLDLSKNLGKKGLTGTLQEISDAITAHMGPDGLVLQNTLNNAKQAAANAQTEIQAMPKNLQALAQSFLAGSVTAKDWRKDLQALTPEQQHLMQQFAATADKTNSFNKLLTSGGPAAQTYANALKTLTGQSDAANAAMLLGGTNAATFHANVKAVGDASKNTGKNISDWSLIQQNFNQKWSEFQARIQVAAVAVGDALIKLIMWFGKLWDAMQPFISFIIGIFKPAFDQLKKALEEQAKAFEPIWKVIKGPVIDALIALAAIIVGPIVIALVAFGAAAYIFIKVATWITDLITWFYKLSTAIVNAIAHPKDLLAQVGHDIIAGLIDGMTGQFGKALDNIKNLGKTIVDGFKNLLGIHSPSTVFAQIGQNMGQGLIQGLQGMQMKASLATTQLMTGSPMGGGSSPAGNSTTNHNSYGGSTQQVTIGQVTLGNSDAVREFFRSLNQDSMNVGRGLTPVQGAY